MNENKVTQLMPCNDFSNVLENAKSILDVGIVIGYGKDGSLEVFGGGMIDGKQPCAKDWLFMVQSFSQKLLNGDYFDE